MRKLYFVALLLVFASAAHADAEKGLYLGAGVGQFNVQIDDVDDLGPIVDEFDSDDTSFKIFGGWRFGKFFAAELDYIDFGGPDDEVDDFQVEAELSGFAVYAVGTVPLGPVELFGRVGYLFYDLEVNVGDQTFEQNTDESDSDLVYGVGVGITLFEKLNTRIEYEIIDISEVVDDADALWLSAAWRF